MAKVLLIDDERLMRELLQDVLTRQGHTVAIAEDGAKGLDLYREYRPDVVLLDLRMPTMDGIAVLKTLRTIDPVARVIMLTGGAKDDLERQAWELGVTDFLRKTIEPTALLATLERVTRQDAGGPSAHWPAAKTGGNSILVVDDEVLIGALIKDHLTALGYEVRTANNGRDALLHIDHHAPDLIIVDMYMPVMNGVQLIRELRGRSFTGAIIALTASKDENLLQEALDLGSVDVMAKPVDFDRLALAIEVGLVVSRAK